MMIKKTRLLQALPSLLLILGLLLAACSEAPATPLPTLIGTAVVPTEPIPTNTPNLPPTSTPAPTNTPIPSATPVLPTREATPLPEESGPAVNITTPGEGAEFILGSQVIVGGLAQVGISQTLTVTLVSATGHELLAVPVDMNEINGWQVSLTIPQSVTGPAQVQAAVHDEEGAILAIDLLGVLLVLDTESVDRYLALYRPVVGDNAVGGFNLFFDGRAEQPVDNVVTISLWTENCQSRVAQQSFTLRGSGYWQGFLILPEAAVGPACAVASFGVPGEPNWREAQVIVNVLDRNDENAKGIVVGNPPPESTLTSGQEIFLYGTAYNAVDGEIRVSVLLENGRVLSEAIASVDFFGYWELSLLIPADAEGLAFINVATGDPAEERYAQNQSQIFFELPPEE